MSKLHIFYLVLLLLSQFPIPTNKICKDEKSLIVYISNILSTQTIHIRLESFFTFFPVMKSNLH